MEPVTLPVGKLEPNLLSELLEPRGHPDERVVVGPRVGEDAAVIDFGDRYLVIKTDPITFATDEIGWYLAQVNANDVAVMGAVPRWLLVTLLLPEGTSTPALAKKIFAQIDAACQDLRIAVVGGHTEITHGLDRPIAVGHLLGEVAKNRLITTSGAQVGDDLVLVKGIAIEGTSIIAREKEKDLQARGYSPEFLARARHYLHDPGIGIVREAGLAAKCVGVHAMHDPTEGGLATALHELALAAHVGVWVDREAIAVWPECASLCAEFGLDPLGLIASGALLVSVSHEQTSTLLAAYQETDVTCAVIGHVTVVGEGLKLSSKAGIADLPRFDQDEIIKLL